MSPFREKAMECGAYVSQLYSRFFELISLLEAEFPMRTYLRPGAHTRMPPLFAVLFFIRLRGLGALILRALIISVKRRMDSDAPFSPR